MANLNHRLRTVQRRLGAREELVAGIVLALVAIAGLGFTLATNYGTPAGAALAYMAAVDRGDTDYVWSHSVVDSSGVGTKATVLLDRMALAAQLRESEHTRSAFAVQGVGYDGGNTKVTLSFTASADRRSVSLLLRGQAPHVWLILLKPAGVDLRIPAGAGALVIDGQSINAAAGTETQVGVLPGLHSVSLSGSRLYEPYNAQFDAETFLPSIANVSLRGVRPTPEAASEAQAVVGDAFKSCAQSTQLSVSGCPQSLNEVDVANGPVRWRLLGDPSANAVVALDDHSVLTASGHFLMSLDYESSVHRRERLLGVGGAYLASLSWDGHALTIGGFQDASSAPAIARPGATDDQVLSALKSQFDSCLRLQAGEVPQCPQFVLALYASSFVWHADSDPMQGATVGWDGKRSVFTVNGTFAFSVDYTSSPPYSPSRQIHDTSSGSYVADLYWDGSKAVFIGFEE